jgi:hypothetical protein
MATQVVPTTIFGNYQTWCLPELTFKTYSRNCLPPAQSNSKNSRGRLPGSQIDSIRLNVKISESVLPGRFWESEQCSIFQE